MSLYDLEKAIGQAVKDAHPCEDNACDIHAMLGEGLYALAAQRLFGATDVPYGDPLRNIDCEPDATCGQCLHCAWNAWAEAFEDEGAFREYIDMEEVDFHDYHDKASAACPHCEAIIYIPVGTDSGDDLYCSNCAKRSVVHYRLELTS